MSDDRSVEERIDDMTMPELRRELSAHDEVLWDLAMQHDYNTREIEELLADARKEYDILQARGIVDHMVEALEETLDHTSATAAANLSPLVVGRLRSALEAGQRYLKETKPE